MNAKGIVTNEKIYQADHNVSNKLSQFEGYAGQIIDGIGECRSNQRIKEYHKL